MRKLVTIKDEIYEDRGKKFDKPIVRFTVAAVLTNPYAGEYIEDLSFLFPFARDLGSKLGKMVVDELGGEEKVETFGKAGIVGEDGELENITSILHGGLAPGYREYVGDYTVAKEYIERGNGSSGPHGDDIVHPYETQENVGSEVRRHSSGVHPRRSPQRRDGHCDSRRQRAKASRPYSPRGPYHQETETIVQQANEH